MNAFLTAGSPAAFLPPGPSATLRPQTSSAASGPQRVGRGFRLPAFGAGLPAVAALTGWAESVAAAGYRGLAMAANLSRNGPALQEAYLRVVTEKSPTDWWAPRRAGGGGERAAGGDPRGRAAAGGP